MVKPSGCSVKLPIETKPLYAQLVSHGAAPNADVKLTPQSGRNARHGDDPDCAIAGFYNMKWSKGIYAEANVWGTSSQVESLTLTPTINSTLGSELVLGSKPAELFAAGTIFEELGKTNK